ncbi:hypothetical protein MPSEU_000259900 [Mayamaea pseudoterrestris]|nr:hypothetical protein MPSEU_000259900 [Mayamaea pseudoterrestris]
MSASSSSRRFDRNISWPPSKSFNAFISSLNAAQARDFSKRNKSALQLIIDSSFLEHLGATKSEKLDDMCSALQQMRLTGIKLDQDALRNMHDATIVRRSASRLLQRFFRLMDALGWIPSLTQGSVSLGTRCGNGIHALQRLPHLQKLSINVTSETTEKSAANCMASIATLDHLSRLEILGETRLYSVILPELCKLKSLTKLSLSCRNSDGKLQATLPSHVKVIADLLHSSAGLQHVTLMHLDFASVDTHNAICHAIANTTISSLELCACQFTNAVEIVQALSKSQLNRLVFTQLIVTDAEEANQFTVMLGSQLQRMTQLNSLEVSLSFRSKRSKRVFLASDEAATTFFKGAGRCPSLKALKVCDCSCLLPRLDEALAECVRASSTLDAVEVTMGEQAMNITCTNTDTYIVPFTFPLLCNVVATTYTIHNIMLRAWRIPSPLEGTLAMRLDTRLLEALTRLNRCGRHYMATDPGNKRMGVNVLSQTSDSLDCLFLHLRENPCLCQRPWRKRLQKRKAPAAARVMPVRHFQRLMRSTRKQRQTTRFHDL